MIAFDELVPSYRRARDRWPGAPMLVAHYQTVVEAYNGTGQSMIETVKSFLECVCRTIMADYGVTPATNTPSTTALLGVALDRLGLRNTRGVSKFDRILAAHNKLADALNECRNQEGSIAHGRDGYLDAMANHHVRMYLITGDTILAMLLGALEGSEPDLQHTREPYERFAHFNEAIDRNAGVTANVDLDARLVVLSFATPGIPEGIELRVDPSRLLYQLDRSAFIEVLDSLPIALDAASEALSSGSRTSAIPLEAPSNPKVPSAKLISTYHGPLLEHLADLEVEISSIGLNLPTSMSRKVAPSLLAAFETRAGLDWAGRPAFRARIVVGFKHVLRAAGVLGPAAEKAANRLVEWFAQRQPSGQEASP